MIGQPRCGRPTVGQSSGRGLTLSPWLRFPWASVSLSFGSRGLRFPLALVRMGPGASCVSCPVGRVWVGSDMRSGITGVGDRWANKQEGRGSRSGFRGLGWRWLDAWSSLTPSRRGSRGTVLAELVTLGGAESHRCQCCHAAVDSPICRHVGADAGDTDCRVNCRGGCRCGHASPRAQRGRNSRASAYTRDFSRLRNDH